MAIDVKEKPAGLMIKASAELRADWIRSTSTPSWLDWWNASSAPAKAASSSQEALMASSVVEP